MKSTIHNLGSFELTVLLALLRAEHDGIETHAAAVHRHAEDKTRKKFSLGAFYGTLSRLQEKKYVSSRVEAPKKIRGGRRTRVFSTTKKGARAVSTTLETITALGR